MTLDEAIQHCWEKIENNKNLRSISELYEDYEGVDRFSKCAQEHRQLARWLMAYKRIIESGCCNDCSRKKCQYAPGWGKLVRYNCPFYNKKE